MCAGTMWSMTNQSFEAENSEKARQEGLRIYLGMVKKATQAPLSAEDLETFNTVLADVGGGGFDDLLGTVFAHIGPERVQLELKVGPSHLQPFGLANGGVYCSLGETAGSIAGFIAGGAKVPVVGVNNNTDFYRSAKVGDVIVSTATPVHLGRTMQVWQIEHVRKSDEKTLARTNLRLAVLNETQK